MVAPPVTYNGMRMPVRRPPPWLSQHTEEVRVHVKINMATSWGYFLATLIIQLCIAFHILHSNDELVLDFTGSRVLSE
jgi:hypothetical protein